METRVALVAIIVRENASVSALNELLHQYGSYMVGRMGVPYRSRGVNIISVAMDAPADVISALSGKIGGREEYECMEEKSGTVPDPNGAGVPRRLRRRPGAR